MAGYLLDNAQAEAVRRFGALAALFDPTTFAVLDAVGVGPGWRVWEVGAGGPSVPAWLAGRVGPTGRVLATDIDPSRVGSAGDGGVPPGGGRDRPGAAVEVRRHDVGEEPPPAGPFDLVHARLVLTHVPRRDAALAAMVDAVRPGGWVVVEDADPGLQPLACLEDETDAQRLANRLKRDFRTLLAGRGADLAYGRSLPGRMRRAGLVDVTASAYFPIGGPVVDHLERATTEQVRARLVDAGLATDEEIDRHLANIGGDDLDLVTSPLVSATGRKP